MSDDNRQRAWLRTNGWRGIVALESAAAGALVAFTVAQMLARGGSGGSSIEPSIVALLGGGGGLVGGALLSGWYGQPGRGGWIAAALASAVAPPLAGALAGTCLVPGVGTAIGAGMALWTFCYPQSVAVWALCLVAIHWHARRLRAAQFTAIGRPQSVTKHCL